MTALELARVSKVRGRGPLAVSALREVSLRIDPGELVLLEGPSRSGKTTLLSVAGGLLHPDSGEVRVGGEVLPPGAAEARRAVRARQIGFVFQRSNLLPGLDALGNVILQARHWRVIAADVARRRSGELLSMRSASVTSPGGRGQGSSAGEEQRFAVARALVHSPRVVLADEPTASLDSAAGRAVVGALVTLGRDRGAAILVATHDPRLRARSPRAACESWTAASDRRPGPRGNREPLRLHAQLLLGERGLAHGGARPRRRAAGSGPRHHRRRTPARPAPLRSGTRRRHRRRAGAVGPPGAGGGGLEGAVVRGVRLLPGAHVRRAGPSVGEFSTRCWPGSTSGHEPSGMRTGRSSSGASSSAAAGSASSGWGRWWDASSGRGRSDGSSPSRISTRSAPSCGRSGTPPPGAGCTTPSCPASSSGRCSRDRPSTTTSRCIRDASSASGCRPASSRYWHGRTSW